ncbi:MAG: methionine adenosyltransferase [Deltaproteobacteria bacterium]|nr:methionine adenosyltransferase [Deltaproteobacteria bacterium]
MNEIHIQRLDSPGVGEQDIEIVERKGLGHPDSICDAVMERISQALSQAYIQRFGKILHHNCDKGLLVAGQVERQFGGGRMVEPMRLIIGDRATEMVGKERLKTREIAVEAAKGWFRENLPRLDPGRHLQYQVELRPGSEELANLFLGSANVLGANDTSAAVGYAPLTETERLVLETERYLNSHIFKSRFPETGEDVKVMGVRTKDHLDLTVAMPLLDQYIEGEAKYFRLKDSVEGVLLSYLHSRQERLEKITVNLNNLDRPGAGMAGMYLSVLGTSAEDADSGEVGRGNQVNGLIALNRPRGSEAAAGKNPVSHVGKIYNLMTHLLARRLHADVPGLREVTVWLCSRIGQPVDQPQMVSAQVVLEKGCALSDVSVRIRQIVGEEFARMPVFCEELVRGVYPIC